MRRLTIYFFYDRDGVVDDFVVHSVSAMAEHSERLLVVSNGDLPSASRARLTEIPRVEVATRPNEGFDVWAYKHAIELLGWETLRSYDEVVFMNFTIVGPLHPLSEMFDAMDGRELDFWGPNIHSGEDYDPWGLLPTGRIEPHLQSHFIAVRRRMLDSPELERYWATMRPVTRYEEAICFHEAIFTRTFADLGFRWEAYVDTSDLAHITSYPLMFLPREVLIERRSPFFKRKALFLSFADLAHEHVVAAHGRFAADTLACAEELGYDTRRILPNIIRTNNQYDLRQTLNAARVLRAGTEADPEPGAKLRVVARVPNLVVCAALERHMAVLGRADELVFVTGGPAEAAVLERLRSQDSATFVTGAGFGQFAREVGVRSQMDDYLLVLGFTGELNPKATDIQYAFHEAALQSVAGTEATLEAGIRALSDDHVLGALTPAIPSVLPESPHESWQTVREIVGSLLSATGVAVPLSDDKPAWGPANGIVLVRPGALGHDGWSVLCQALGEFEPGAAERIFNALIPFILQSRGWLLGTASPDTFDGSTLTLLQYLLVQSSQHAAMLEQTLQRAVGALHQAGLIQLNAA